MKTALKIFSIIGVVLGGLAILGGLLEPYDDGIYTLVGGELFLTQGILALVYMKGK